MVYVPDHPTALNGMFQAPPPGQGPRTVVQAAVMNSLVQEQVNLLASAGMVPDPFDDSQLAKALQRIATSGLYTNLLANPWMQIHQRGLSGSVAASSSGYAFDRWKIASPAGVTTTWAEPTGTGIPDVSDPSGFFGTVPVLQGGFGSSGTSSAPSGLKLTTNAAGTVTVSQLIDRDDIGRFANLSVALAAAGSSDATITLKLVTLGAGFVPIATVTAAAKPVTTEYSLLAEVFAVTPDPSAIYLRLEVEITRPAGGFTVTLTGLSLSTTNFAIPFPSVRPFQHELDLCQRYFESSSVGGVKSGLPVHRLYHDTTVTNGGRVYEASEALRVPKVKPPTVTFYEASGNPTAGTMSVAGAQHNVSSVTQSTVQTLGYPTLQAGFPAAVSVLIEYQWEADSELE